VKRASYFQGPATGVWEARKHDSEIAQRDLSAWYKSAKHAAWANFGALRRTFGSADQVGNCIVYDVGNNRFRLIGRVKYTKPDPRKKGIIYVLRVMDHKEYDKGTWAEDCGCFRPPPKKPETAKAKRNRFGRK
jgi:mRNA interferase HigB